MENWFSQAVSGILEMKWYTLVILAALVCMGIVLVAAGRKTRWNSRRIAFAAMCIAISFVLSYIKLFRFPQGGTITPFSMLPMIAFAVACGPVQGALVGCAYGLLQLIQDAYIVHPMQMLVDYPLAFGFLALGGLVTFMPIKEKYKLPVAVVLATLGRYAMAVLSGTVFFAEYAPEGQPALLYSLVYNISYLGPDAALCLIAAFVPGIARVVDILRGKGKAESAA